MANKSSNQRKVRRFAGIALAAFLALGTLVFSAQAMSPSRDVYTKSGANGGYVLYLPILMGDSSPAGNYYCLEYEYGLIWTSEVITLNPDGTSVYVYNPPYPGTVTGTWSYTASTQEVQFTNFRWQTATYVMPYRIWASRYVPQTGFDVAISCSRQ